MSSLSSSVHAGDFLVICSQKVSSLQGFIVANSNFAARRNYFFSTTCPIWMFEFDLFPAKLITSYFTAKSLDLAHNLANLQYYGKIEGYWRIWKKRLHFKGILFWCRPFPLRRKKTVRESVCPRARAFHEFHASLCYWD